MRRFATWCTGHRKTVIIGWIVALIVIGMHRRRGRRRLQRRIQAARLRLQGSLRPARKQVPGPVRRHARQIVFKADGGVESPAVKQKMEGGLRGSRRVPPRQRSRQPLRGGRRGARSATTARSPTRRSSSTSPATSSTKRRRKEIIAIAQKRRAATASRSSSAASRSRKPNRKKAALLLRDRPAGGDDHPADHLRLGRGDGTADHHRAVRARRRPQPGHARHPRLRHGRVRAACWRR